MLSKVRSYGLYGIDAYEVTAECNLLRGLPSFDVVGLPDSAVKESRDRVRSALRHNGYEFPVSRITLNLAPADVKKSGPLYDLPIFVAMLLASGQLRAEVGDFAFAGELSLAGELRPVAGCLSMALLAAERGVKALFLPADNAAEAAVVRGVNVIPVRHVDELALHLSGEAPISPAAYLPREREEEGDALDFKDVKGQAAAKRALEIAAAGGHNLLMIGPPGSGKSMLAKRFRTILPEMSFEESIEATKIHSVAGLTSAAAPLVTARPFRSPHHTVSPAGLSGGGVLPRPGEISLAHGGVLFLDEFPEFSRAAMEALRQPIEDNAITISRAAGSIRYPCSVTLIAAMNPCPCGFFGHPTRRCRCSRAAIDKYLSKISGPLLDRLDLHIEVAPVMYDKLRSLDSAESSAAIRARVNAARDRQRERYRGTDTTCNARMTPAQQRACCLLPPDASDFLRAAFERLSLSARAHDRILKVARTIADLDGSAGITAAHVAEAVQYRGLDRKYWDTRQF